MGYLNYVLKYLKNVHDNIVRDFADIHGGYHFIMYFIMTFFFLFFSENRRILGMHGMLVLLGIHENRTDPHHLAVYHIHPRRTELAIERHFNMPQVLLQS